MGIGLKTKKGFWGKLGGGGSYRGYVYFRAAPKDGYTGRGKGKTIQTEVGKSYSKLPQQATVGERGRAAAINCKGKTGSEYTSCRHDYLTGKKKAD